MPLEYGIALGIIGMILSIVVLFVAYYFVSRENKEVKYEDLTSVQKSLRDIFDRKK